MRTFTNISFKFDYTKNGDIMHKKYLYNYLKLILPIIVFMIISIISIYSSQNLLSLSYNTLYIKQIIWYIIGFFIAFLISNLKSNYIYKNTYILYIIGNIFLILVLFFGTKSNGAKCWFNIPMIGFIQPSEFMKIILILVLSNILNKYKNMKRTFKNELILIFKCFMLTLIPCIFIFLEPDTGLIFIFFSILIVMLFIYSIRYRWFIIIGIITCLLSGSFLILFFKYQNLFINIFGNKFFYRMDRLIDFKNGSGMQLTNALAATGSAGLFGYGFNKTPIYFPEPQTDFIFSIFSSNFGFISSIILLLIILYFDLSIIKIAIKCNFQNKLIISGILSILLFQQTQNIGMNIGLLPITGITLPFISYGGSSLISYMIMIGIILNIIKKETINR